MVRAQSFGPVAAAQDISDAQPLGKIYGLVTDSAGDVIMGASVTLVENASKAATPKAQHVATTDNSGFFTFNNVALGSYQLTVTANGFAPWAGEAIALAAGQSYEASPIVLQVAAANTSVHVNFSSHELATEQMHVQEKQRVLGVFPNFYTSYVWDAEPLTSKQKFKLALRTTIDPVTFLGTGAVAGIEQWDDDFSGYGQGREGYAKRYGAAYADGFIGTMLGGAVLPSILHQDPRYFYKGTGSVRSRALYAISTVVICKGDNGRWQPNYSNVLGNLGAAAISNIYYPSTNRGAVTIDNALIGTASGAIGALLQEFVIRKISNKAAKTTPGGQP